MTDGNTMLGKIFYISSPASGTITPNTTYITFTQRSVPASVYGSTSLSAAYATTAALSPSPTFAAGVFTAQYPGPLVIDGYTLGSGNRVLVKNQATQSQTAFTKSRRLVWAAVRHRWPSTTRLRRHCPRTVSRGVRSRRLRTARCRLMARRVQLAMTSWLKMKRPRVATGSIP